MKASGVTGWKSVDGDYAVGEFRAKLNGWSVERRFIVIRERVRESRSAVGRRLFEIPGYTFRVMVTSMQGEPAAIWRDYNKRGDMENRIKELKYDLAADDFCMVSSAPPKRRSGRCCRCSTCLASKGNGQVAPASQVADGGFSLCRDPWTQGA